ncbi:MAG: hypothetical protein SFU85_06205 [Candidatus Methylacidiphilales bacterium]|nr:hypothetical protein [Candidatus Methylacidiphilales bacterium]
MDPWPFLLFGGLVLVFISVVLVGWHLEKKRREAFRAFATAAGWTYQPEKDPAAARSYAFLRHFSQGDNRYLHHRFRGEFSGRAFDLFEYHYQVTSGAGKNRRTTHYHFRAAVSPLPRAFPELVISPENFLDRVAAVFGFDDIDFESAEFSRTFKVKSPDRKFAYDVIHPLMMEWLMRRTGTTVEIEGNHLAVIDKGTLDIPHIEPLLAFMAGIHERLPGYLLTENQT